MSMTFMIVDEKSFISKGLTEISSEFMRACETLGSQINEGNGIDHVTFKHVDYGEDITVYMRRYDGQVLVSLEDKDFTIED